VTSLADNVETAAKDLAGNWRKFQSFGWYERPADPDSWCIVYTSNRDSRLIEQSNAAEYEKALAPFMWSEEHGEHDADVIPQSHNHWAVGHVDGYVIRVYKDGQITQAFRTYHELRTREADYPLLNEEDYSSREHEATWENVKEVGQGFARRNDGCELPDGDDWVSEVFSWLWDNDQSAVENRDDQGGYPSEEQMGEALAALGYHSDPDAEPEADTDPVYNPNTLTLPGLE
jgi:hypothetical protein